MPTYEIYNLNY